MKKLISILAVLLTAALVFSGCGNGNSNTPATTPNTAPDSGDDGSGGEPPASGEEVVITIWYEGNDSRLPYFQAVEAEMQKDYPNYSIEAVTFDNATLTTKALQAVTTTGGVDLIFNSASRLLTVHQQSDEGFADLSDVLATAVNNEVMTEGDLHLSSKDDALIVFPINRSLAGLGVKTDVDGVDVDENSLPGTWEEFVALGRQYQAAGTSGFTMHLGTDQKQVFNLFLCGSGMSDIWLNATPESQVLDKIDYLSDVASVYAGDDYFWDKDATSEDFAAMYTKIQSGSVGMFRVGDWNVANWDQPDSGVGDYLVTTWPAMDGSGASGLVNTDTRGMSMPKNAPNPEAAKVFLRYALSEPAQKMSFETMGSCIDLSVVDMDALTPNQKIFFDPSISIFPVDVYSAQFSYYPELEEVYSRGLINALNSSDEAAIRTNLEQLHEDLNAAIASNQ